MLISCSECRKELSDTAKKCPNCGAATSKSKKSKSTKLIVFGVLLSLFGALMTYVGIQNIKNADTYAELSILSSELRKSTQQLLDLRDGVGTYKEETASDRYRRDLRKDRLKRNIKEAGIKYMAIGVPALLAGLFMTFAGVKKRKMLKQTA